MIPVRKPEQKIVSVPPIAYLAGGKIRLKLDKPRTVKLSHQSATAHDHVARAVQIKIADNLEPGRGAELKYEIMPFSE